MYRSGIAAIRISQSYAQQYGKRSYIQARRKLTQNIWCLPACLLMQMSCSWTYCWWWDCNRSPFARGGTRGSSASVKPVVDYSMPDSDISFVSSGRPSLDRGYGHQRLSSAVDSFEHSFDSGYGSYSGSNDYSSYSQGSSSTAVSVQKELTQIVSHTMHQQLFHMKRYDMAGSLLLAWFWL